MLLNKSIIIIIIINYSHMIALKGIFLGANCTETFIVIILTVQLNVKQRFTWKAKGNITSSSITPWSRTREWIYQFILHLHTSWRWIISLPPLAALPPKKETHWIGGWMRPRTGLDDVERRENLPVAIPTALSDGSGGSRDRKEVTFCGTGAGKKIGK
jgi:hypothetical protein